MEDETAQRPTEPALPRTSTNGFLFADLRDYSAYVEQEGDLAAAELLRRYRGIVRAVIARHEGAEIRTEGDSFYVVLPSASLALRCGMAILDVAGASQPPLRVGIGVHAGETADTGEGPVGSAVNICSRVCAQAGAGELLATETVRVLTRTLVPFRFVPRGSPRLKGISEPIALYRVVRPDDAAALAGVATPAAAASMGGPPPDRAGRRRRTMGLVAGGVVVAALATGIAAIVLRPSTPPGSTGLPGSPTAAATTAAVITSSPPASSALSAGERDLVARLPSDVAPTCVPSTGTALLPGAAANVTCPLSGEGAEAVSWSLFDQLPVLLTSYDVFVRAAGDPTGDCRDGPRGSRPWSLGKSISGHVVCYPVAGRAHIVWTYDAGDGAGILASAARGDADWGALYAWWNATAPFISH